MVLDVEKRSTGRRNGSTRELQPRCSLLRDARFFHLGIWFNRLETQRFGPALLRSPSGRGRFASRSLSSGCRIHADAQLASGVTALTFASLCHRKHEHNPSRRLHGTAMDFTGGGVTVGIRDM
jgi:hypothetical protein